MIRRKSNDENDDLWKEKEFHYGKLQLSGFRVIAGRHPRFVRASKNINVDELNDKLYKLMTEVWNFNAPQLIISMNGGAKRMIPLNNDQKLAFKRGLIDVAKSAPTWIITGGFQDGVSKLVGEAAKDYSILSKDQEFAVLGIATWGAVFHKEKIEKQAKDVKVIYTNVEAQNIGKGKSVLDPYHNAYILYDDGSESKFGGEIEFRTQFEEYAAKRAKCSVVQVIVEGGKNTIETGAKALKSKTPVVVMKGSRRAADVICDVVESSDALFENEVNMKITEYSDEWNLKESVNQQIFKDNLKTFRQYHKEGKVHLFKMADFKNNLDTAIIEAAFSGTIDGKPLEDEAKLKLAITFNRADVAEEKIFLNQKNIQFRHHMKLVLIKNQWQFVDLFLKQGLTIESFLTRNILQDLYFSKEADQHLNPAVIAIIRERYYSSKVQKLSTIGNILNRLSDGLLLDMYKDHSSDGNCYCCWDNVKISDSQETEDGESEPIDFEKYIEPKHNILQNSNCCKSQNNSIEYEHIYYYTMYPTRNKSQKIIYTEQDLFIWALLTQRIEMAKIFWKNGKDHIGSALIATVICNSLKRKAETKGEIEIMNNLQSFQEYFEIMAIGVLAEAYRRDQTRTHLLLIRALPYWGRESCLDIANKHQIINFLFHSACQTRLNKIWLGRIPPFVNIFRILINIPFGFLTSRIFLFPCNFCAQNDDDVNLNESVVLTQNQMYTSKSKDNGFSNGQESSIRKENSTDMIIEKLKEKKKKNEAKEFFLTKFRNAQQIEINEINFFSAIKIFYTAPVTKFIMNIISFLTFLTTFTYMMIVELNTLTLSPTPDKRQIEYVVYTFYLSFLLGEIRQFFMGGQSNNVQSKLNNWKSSMWNWFDLVNFVIFAIAFILRCTVTDSNFIYCRTLYAISLSMFYIRFMEFYYVQQSVGPKVIMISRMMKDILFFMAIYLIALLSYGTFAMALLYSNSPINGTIMKQIIYNPYWQLFGQVDINYMEGSNCYYGICATPNTMVIVANAIFLLFSNVLLLSLLIAMFGVTFTKVEENSKRVWAFTRYRLIEEFYYRPILPPPLNVFEIIFHFFKIMNCNKNNKDLLSIDNFIANLTHEEDQDCSGFEQQCMETYLITNPLLSTSTTQDTKTPLSKSSNDENQDQEVPIENQLILLMSSMLEIKKELNSVSEKVHKIRRFQKKNYKKTLTLND